jgi:transcription elongation factor GreA
MKTYHFTKEGYSTSVKEKEQLLTERPFIVSEVKRARELGDLSENGLYKSSKMRLVQIDSRVFRITTMLKYAKIIETTNSDRIELGSTVTISDGKRDMTYTIVGSEEANPKEGKISNISPLGKGLLGKRKNDRVEVNQFSYTITSIK